MGTEETGGQLPEETPVPDDQAPAEATVKPKSPPPPPPPPPPGDDDGGVGPDVIFHG